MRPIRTILAVFLGLWLSVALASAIAAIVAKSRLVSRGLEADDEVDLVTIYDGLDFASTAPAFRGGSILCWYGGGSIDLRGATLDPAGARLRVRALFGGLRLVVPETWRVENRITAILGGVGDARDESQVAADGPTLVLEGWAAFGGIGIAADAPDLEARATPVEAPAPA